MVERDKFSEKNFRLCFRADKNFPFALSRDNNLANDFTFSLIKLNLLYVAMNLSLKRKFCWNFVERIVIKSKSPYIK